MQLLAAAWREAAGTRARACSSGGSAMEVPRCITETSSFRRCAHTLPPYTVPRLSHRKPYKDKIAVSVPFQPEPTVFGFATIKIFILLPCFRFAHPLQKAELDRFFFKSRNKKKNAYLKLRLKSKVFL